MQICWTNWRRNNIINEAGLFTLHVDFRSCPTTYTPVIWPNTYKAPAAKTQRPAFVSMYELPICSSQSFSHEGLATSKIHHSISATAVVVEGSGHSVVEKDINAGTAGLCQQVEFLARVSPEWD